MDSLIKRIFIDDWRQKVVAVLGAFVIWLFIHQSITETKTLPNVPIRLVNIPSDRTLQGLLPNGLLNRRVNLTVSGTKDVIDNLESSDLEVLIDASTLPDEWVLQVSKKNLISLNPEIDLLHHISTVSNNELVIKMSRLITERIPVYIAPPLGTAPEGYQFLDIYPQTLYHTITGPEELLHQLEEKGFHLTFDLDEISKSQLDQLKGSELSFRSDEVNFPVPDRWKTLLVPFESELPEIINDPRAKELHITFLRKEIIPIGQEIPIRVFYPIEYSGQINPGDGALATNELVVEENDLKLFRQPLYLGEVSRLFIDIVKNNLELVVVAAPHEEREFLQWSLEFINQRELEETFVSLLLSDRNDGSNQKKREVRLRRRFREYMQSVEVFREKGQRLMLEARLQEHTITVKDVSGTY